MKPLNLLLALIVALLLMSPMPAIAQATGTCESANENCTEGKAYTSCIAAVGYTLAANPGAIAYMNCPKGGSNVFSCGVRPKDSTANMCRNANGISQFSYIFTRSCIALEALPPGLIIFDGYDKAEICASGCKFKRGDAPTDNYDIEGFASTVGTVGGWTPTGAVCSDNEPPAKNEPQCVAGAGQTLCIKPNGEKCATASNGKTFCWGKGDDGDKKDGNQYGTNGEGNPRAPAPEPKPADNSDWKPPQNCTTVHERSGSGYTGRTNVICTGTSTGTPNPPACNPTTDPNCRRPSDNNTQCDPKTDPRQCQAGSASGGGTCEAPPTCAGDPINCAVLTQVWRSRCSANGNKATASDCSTTGAVTNFTCSGDEILCRQTRINAEEQCRNKQGDKNGNGRPDWTELDGSENPEDGDGEAEVETITFGPAALDTSGFLTAGCPSIPTGMTGLFGAIKLTGDYWCPLVTGIRAITIALGMFIAFRILFG